MVWTPDPIEIEENKRKWKEDRDPDALGFFYDLMTPGTTYEEALALLGKPQEDHRQSNRTTIYYSADLSVTLSLLWSGGPPYILEDAKMP